ncbi:Lacal_2735 family protein [Reichenbachiella ulvae]|uniref:Lacal_2735 family protein n=1 Tax=Reichenbachiella ulvae TaxID=2980104 RepID=A0ABT3CZH1_9BACT|nr:Lacal_2735 family protein [Reichenbachiella ulvae]MCV9388959.1 Lacal_2735 family protein [Reichenbachiella ulvae]
MFGIFKKKSEREKLNERYKKLMKESHQLSTTDRSKSDQKFAEAQELLTQLDNMEKENS